MFFYAIPEGDIEKKFNTAPIFFTATKCKQRNNLAISFPKKTITKKRLFFPIRNFGILLEKYLWHTHTHLSVYFVMNLPPPFSSRERYKPQRCIKKQRALNLSTSGPRATYGPPSTLMGPCAIFEVIQISIFIDSENTSRKYLLYHKNKIKISLHAHILAHGYLTRLLCGPRSQNSCPPLIYWNIMRITNQILK